MINYAERLPEMLFGEQLKQALVCLPYYDATIRNAEPGRRLLKLMDLYKIFLPGSMAAEIYHKLYMMTSMSLEQKGSITSVKQANANHRWMNGGEFHGVATGATSATVIGCSGIGKTTCIRKSMDLLGGIIEVDKPYRKLIPVLMVSTPFDCNYKGLLCQILISIDEVMGSNYYEKSQKSNVNAQQILGMVSQLCHQFVGTLIIDEIQFIVQHKAGPQLYRMILQMINTSCNILLIGTNECLPFFSQGTSAFQMARRSVGLQYFLMEYDLEFRHLCEVLFSYQYVAQESNLTEGVMSWLYEHTGGNPSTLVSLIHDGQELAILDGTEQLGLDSLTKAYNERLQMLHGYMNQGIKRKAQTGDYRAKVELPVKAEKRDSLTKIFTKEMDQGTFTKSFIDNRDCKQEPNKSTSSETVFSNADRGLCAKSEEHRTIADMVAEAKAGNLDITSLFRQQFSVVEVGL